MWNNYFSGRPKRNVPEHNYNESSSEEEDNFQSPERPPVTRAGSPAELAVPQLNDNVDEELQHVQQTLRNVGHTKLFRQRFKEEIKKEEDEEEIVAEGHIVGVAASPAPLGNPAPIANMAGDDEPVVEYDVANTEDGAKAH